MGKRPYYIIYWTRDYEGYETYVEYVGSNYQAALARYTHLFGYIKDREFIQENIPEERIEARFNLPSRQLEPHQEVSSYLNDNDCCWISVTLKCLNTDAFDGSAFEERYRQDVPNGKH